MKTLALIIISFISVLALDAGWSPLLTCTSLVLALIWLALYNLDRSIKIEYSISKGEY